MPDTREFQITNTGKYYGFYSKIGRDMGIPGRSVRALLEVKSNDSDALNNECIPFEECGLTYEDQTFEKIFIQEMRREIMKAICSISKREMLIISMYYGLCLYKSHTLQEIGKEFHLTRERVRLIRERAVRKIFKNPKTRYPLSRLLDDDPYGPVKKKPKKESLYDQKKPSALEYHKPTALEYHKPTKDREPSKRYMTLTHLKDGRPFQYPQPESKFRYDVHSTSSGEWYYVFSYNDIRDDGVRNTLQSISAMYDVWMTVKSPSGEVVSCGGGGWLNPIERSRLYEKACR